MARPRKESPPDAVWIPQCEAARRLETSTPRLIGLRKRGKFPAGVFDEGSGKYHWGKLQECWEEATLGSNNGGRVKPVGGGGDDSSTKELQRKRAEADADNAALRALKEAGKLVDASHAGACAAVVVGRVRTIVQKMPDDRSQFLANRLGVKRADVRDALAEVSADMVKELQGVDIHALLEEVGGEGE